MAEEPKKEESKEERKEKLKKELWEIAKDVLKAGVMLCALVLILFFAFLVVYLFREKVVADLLGPARSVSERCFESFQNEPSPCINLMAQVLWWSWLMASTMGVLLLALVWSILRAVVEYHRSVESTW